MLHSVVENASWAAGNVAKTVVRGGAAFHELENARGAAAPEG